MVVLGLALAAAGMASEPGLQLAPNALRQVAEPPADTPSVHHATPHRLVTPDGTSLPLRRWGPAPEAGQSPEVVVLGLHGFNDHAGALVATAAALVPDGIAVYAYDQRGFGATALRGDWPGTGTLVSDARWALGVLQRRYPDTSIAVIGLSMGAAVATLAMDGQPSLDPAAAILVGPAFWGHSAVPAYQRLALWTAARFMPGLTLSNDWIGIEPSDDPDVLRALEADPLWIGAPTVESIAGVSDLMDRALRRAPRFKGPPTLIQYGTADEVIPPVAVCDLLSALPTAAPWRAAIYPDGYHMLTRYSGADTVLADIRHFLADPDGVLPSGEGLEPAAARQRVCRIQGG
ncbi:alpha/beta fold hydrolase [Spiribacter vilamensis]|uniref:Alpha-beta hydrolase superfamily lysophospholipase n=1 Tax=Spiribacter vilamensis TaxID=531306 RepID=A0A4Q8D0J6_9GAMM|nr:alpha/beta fold hydrolase [Spiribacter vilamensis]RZU98740.1 alpha-beta hydrolase superfamily lysophospholipase [Spiribacter vilamensis]TVO62237.1 lysophospholipase [Spiribacter vilamensis]